MNVLVLGCSPRPNGNTDWLADRIAEELDHCELVYLRDCAYAPCDGCGACGAAGQCKFVDGATELYDRVLRADVVYIVAPAYFYSFDAHTKAWIDRAQFRWGKAETRSAKICLVAVGGQNFEDNFDGMSKTVRTLCIALGMQFGGALCFGGVDARGEIETGSSFARLRTFLAETSFFLQT